MATQRLKQVVLGQDHERRARIETRVGAEMAHMMRKHVALTLRVKVRKMQWCRWLSSDSRAHTREGAMLDSVSSSRAPACDHSAIVNSGVHLSQDAVLQTCGALASPRRAPSARCKFVKRILSCAQISLKIQRSLPAFARISVSASPP